MRVHATDWHRVHACDCVAPSQVLPLVQRLIPTVAKALVGARMPDSQLRHSLERLQLLVRRRCHCCVGVVCTNLWGRHRLLLFLP